MCGILAIAAGTGGGTPGPSTHAVQAALRQLAPRGPDAQGAWRESDGSALLAHTRLAIVDPGPASNQPMRDDDAGLTITFNGEIYNAPDIRQRLIANGVRFRTSSDTEVLLQSIKSWGIDRAIDTVRGMFAFILWDARNRTIHAATDHVGMKPLVYRASESRFAAASTLDALRAATPDEAWEIHANALASVLCRGYVPPPATVWRGVHRLEPGTRLTWQAGGRPQITRWWRPPHEADLPAVTPEELADLLAKVTHRHLHADVPVAALLSAGLDSTAVVHAAARATKPMQCLTLTMDGEHNEAPAAARNAAALGHAHSAVPLRADHAEGLLREAALAFDQPQAHGALLTMLAVSRAASQHAKVVLAGDGGDEALAGYTWHTAPNAFDETLRGVTSGVRLDHPSRASVSERWAALHGLAATSPVAAHLQRVFPRFHPDEARELLAPLGCSYTIDDYVGSAEAVDAPQLPPTRRAQHVDLLTFTAGSILPKVDLASMHHALEVRVPFLDRDILERTIRARTAPDGTPDGKDLLRATLAPVLPQGATNRPKQGFSLRALPMSFWDDQREALRRAPLVADGLIHSDWYSFVADRTPYHHARTLALVMINNWYAHRIDTHLTRQSPAPGVPLVESA